MIKQFGCTGPLAFRQNPDEPWYDTLNGPLWREVEIASGSGHGNARGVARIYGATVGQVDGISLMSQAQLERMISEQHNQTELLQERLRQPIERVRAIRDEIRARVEELIDSEGARPVEGGRIR